MNIQKYLAFTTTVECGSLTKAAKLLGYTQSGISHMISDLEDEWGVVLLERNRSGVRISSDGLKLLPHVQSICATQKELMVELDALHGLDSGLIRIGVFSSVATHWLPGIIKVFQGDYPNIEFELLLGDYTEIEHWITIGRVDFGFLSLPVNPSLESVPLDNDPLLAVLPENHPLTLLSCIPIAALAAEPFILLERSAKTEITGLFESRGLTPWSRFTTWDDYAVMSMVESGLGVSILPSLIMKRAPYRIVKRPLEGYPTRQIGYVMKSSKTASLAVKKFLTYLHYRGEAHSETFPDQPELRGTTLP